MDFFIPAVSEKTKYPHAGVWMTNEEATRLVDSEPGGGYLPNGAYHCARAYPDLGGYAEGINHGTGAPWRVVR